MGLHVTSAEEMALERKLKKCPFCKGKAEFVYDPFVPEDAEQWEKDRRMAMCTEGCGVSTPWYPNAEAAMKGWNMREGVE